jgi:hypothetical protein
MTTNELNAMAHVGICGIYGLTDLLIAVFSVRNHGILALCLHTGFGSAFAIAIFIFQTQLTRYELFLKEVRVRD